MTSRSGSSRRSAWSPARYEPLEIRFNAFKAPAAGRYRIRFNAFSVWVGPGKGKKWWTPDLDDVSPGRRSEPVTVYAETPPRCFGGWAASTLGRSRP